MRRLTASAAHGRRAAAAVDSAAAPIEPPSDERPNAEGHRDRGRQRAPGRQRAAAALRGPVPDAGEGGVGGRCGGDGGVEPGTEIVVVHVSENPLGAPVFTLAP